MAVTKINEIWEGRRATVDQLGRRQYTRIWRVFTNSPYDGPYVATTAPGLPTLFDTYQTPNNPLETDLGAWVAKITPQQDAQDPRIWLITVEYSSVIEKPNQSQQNPLLRAAEVSWDFVKYQKPLTQDTITNAPITNSAGEPFDPPYMIDDSRLTLTVQRNEASYNPLTALSYQDAVNSDAFMGALPGQAKLETWTGRSVYENGMLYFKVLYKIGFRRETWTIQLLDQGLKQLVGAVLSPIVDDKYKVPVTAPVLLDGSGKQLGRPAAPTQATGFSVGPYGGGSTSGTGASILTQGATTSGPAVTPTAAGQTAILPAGVLVPDAGAILLNGTAWTDLAPNALINTPLAQTYQWNTPLPVFRQFNGYKLLPFAALGLVNL